MSRLPRHNQSNIVKEDAKLVLSNRRRQTLVRLLTAAKQVECENKLACGVVLSNRIVHISCNSNKTHTISKNSRMKAIHAEMGAARSFKNLSKYALYVVRTRPSGPGLAKPCKYCVDVLREAKCKQVYYTTSQTWEEFLLNPDVRILNIGK